MKINDTNFRRLIDGNKLSFVTIKKAIGKHTCSKYNLFAELLWRWPPTARYLSTSVLPTNEHSKRTKKRMHHTLISSHLLDNTANENPISFRLYLFAVAKYHIVSSYQRWLTRIQKMFAFPGAWLKSDSLFVGLHILASHTRRNPQYMNFSPRGHSNYSKPWCSRHLYTLI